MYIWRRISGANSVATRISARAQYFRAAHSRAQNIRRYSRRIPPLPISPK